jgi:hypothetical protein
MASIKGLGQAPVLYLSFERGQTEMSQQQRVAIKGKIMDSATPLK